MTIWSDIQKLINNRKVVNITKIGNELWLVETHKLCINQDRPNYIGNTVLDLSKWLMFDYFHNLVVKTYGHENVKLCYGDTDSLIIQISQDDKNKEELDVFRDIALKYNKWYDLSDYKKSHPVYKIVQKHYGVDDKVLNKYIKENKIDCDLDLDM